MCRESSPIRGAPLKRPHLKRQRIEGGPSLRFQIGISTNGSRPLGLYFDAVVGLVVGLNVAILFDLQVLTNIMALVDQTVCTERVYEAPFRVAQRAFTSLTPEAAI